MAIKFEESQFNRIFPFFILIEEDLTVSSIGKTLEKILKEAFGKSFFLNFNVNRPVLITKKFFSLAELVNQLVVIECMNKPGTTLRGQFEYLPDTNQLLFLGSPWFGSMEQVVESKLNLKDFAFHDPLIDLLHVLKTQEITNDDLKELVKTINKQKEALKTATKEIHDIALFPMQNPDPLIRIDINGNVLKQNPAAEKFVEFIFKGKRYSSLEFWKIFGALLDPKAEREVFEAESFGKIYSFVVKSLPEFGYFNIYGRDITQQKEDESHIKLLAMVASANENGVLFINEEGVIYWCNQGMEVITGHHKEIILGKTPIELLKGPLSDREDIRQMRDDFSRQRSFTHELIHYRKDGSWYWGKTTGQPIQYGNGVIHFFVIIEDITSQKQKEEQLRVLSSIAAENTHGVVISNKQGQIEWVNKSFSIMTGYSMEELVGTKPGKFLQGPDTDPETISFISRQIHAGEPFICEILNYHKSGRPYWLRIQGQALKDEKGNILKYFAIEEDVTQKKKAEEKLKEFESKFRVALEKIGDNVWEHDFITGKTYFSKQMNEFLGTDTFDESLNDQLWWNSIHPDDLPKIQENDRKCRNGEIDFHTLEYRIIHKDGSIHWVLDRGVVTEKEKTGKPLKMTGTHTNITNIKETEMELSNRLKQFKSLSESIPGVIYEFEFRKDGTEKMRYVSPAMEKIFGVDTKNFYDFQKYVHPDDLPEIIRKNRYSRKTLEPFYNESRLLIPGREEMWQSVSSSFSYATPDDSLVFTGFMLDITDRKKFEKTLQANEEKYRSIIANMNLGLMELNKDQKVIFANKRLMEMVDLQEEEIFGLDAYQFLTADDIDQVKAKYNVRETGITEAYELKVKNNGKEGWWFVSTAPKIDESGEYNGSIIICLDINERKELERQLILAREKAEQLSKTKEIFLANMSHEIRTPMNAIIGMSNQLTKSILDKNQHMYLKTIQAASENLLIIINDILDFSKIEAGKLDLEYIGFDPREIISHSMQVMMYKAEEKGLLFNDISDDIKISPVLIGDPFRINQVLLNLISNAIKFTEKGYVDVKLEVLEDKAESQKIKIEVKDTGIGMDDEFVKQMFDKFTQESKSGARKFEGTGLGMSISKDLINLMGGEIIVTSKKDSGTSIAFILELVKGKDSDLPSREILQIPDNFLSGKRILVVDDNDHNRLVASIILQNYGATISEAHDGQEALDTMNYQPFDLILMDILMPVLDGYEATARIREKGINIPIIALTANAIKGENVKCIEVGMNDYISKPFKEKDYINTIAKWLLPFPVSQNKDTSMSQPKQNDILYDLETIKAFSRGNDTFMIKMAKLFCDETPIEIAEMKGAFYQNDLSRMGAIAHKLKPNLANFNIKQLEEEIQLVEDAGKENVNLPHLKESLHKIENVCMQVIIQMKKDFPKNY